MFSRSKHLVGKGETLDCKAFFIHSSVDGVYCHALASAAGENATGSIGAQILSQAVFPPPLDINPEGRVLASG